MDNAHCRWRCLFCFTKGSLAVHLSADWRQRCLFEPLGCKEINSLAVLSQSFSRAWLFMGDSLHGPQLNPVLPVIAILQRVALCKSRDGALLHWKNVPDTHWLELKGWIHIFLIKSSCLCFQVGTILDGVSPSPVFYLKYPSSLLFFVSEQQQERSLWKCIYPKARKENGVKESREVNV